MRISMKEKQAMFKEIQEDFGLFKWDKEHNVGLAIEHPQQLIVPQVKGDMILQSERSEYDFTIQVESNIRAYIKIFKSKRNFLTHSAIRSRYFEFYKKNLWYLQQYAGENDLWYLFVTTPKGWDFCRLPIFVEQYEQIRLIEKETRAIPIRIRLIEEAKCLFRNI